MEVTLFNVLISVKDFVENQLVFSFPPVYQFIPVTKEYSATKAKL